MSYLFVLNFDAEYELESGKRYTASDAVKRRSQELTEKLRLPLESHVWNPEHTHHVPLDAKIRVWCATASAQKTARQLGSRHVYPDPSIVRTVNGRAYCYDLSARLGVTEMKTTTLCFSSEAVHRFLRLGGPTQWLLKRNWGVAGRGQRKILGAPSEQDHFWIEKSLRDGPLLIEPWVEIVTEFSQHGWVGMNVRLGKCGAFQTKHRAIDLSAGAASTQRLNEHTMVSMRARAEQVGHALKASGYVGPFGIDGYMYRDAHGTHLRTLSEINARFCFGWDSVLDGWDP